MGLGAAKHSLSSRTVLISPGGFSGFCSNWPDHPALGLGLCRDSRRAPGLHTSSPDPAALFGGLGGDADVRPAGADAPARAPGLAQPFRPGLSGHYRLSHRPQLRTGNGEGRASSAPYSGRAGVCGPDVVLFSARAALGLGLAGYRGGLFGCGAHCPG